MIRNELHHTMSEAQGRELARWLVLGQPSTLVVGRTSFQLHEDGTLTTSVRVWQPGTDAPRPLNPMTYRPATRADLEDRRLGHVEQPERLRFPPPGDRSD